MVNELAEIPRELVGILEQISKILQDIEPAVAVRHQLPEGLVREQDPTSRIGDDHRLFRNPDVAAELLELVLRNQRSHRAKLQHDVGHRLPDQPR